MSLLTLASMWTGLLRNRMIVIQGYDGLHFGFTIISRYCLDGELVFQEARWQLGILK
jgi:hypothetical protein